MVVGDPSCGCGCGEGRAPGKSFLVRISSPEVWQCIHHAKPMSLLRPQSLRACLGGAWLTSCAACSQTMEDRFLSISWGCSPLSTLCRRYSIFSLYFLPPPLLVLEKEPTALRHAFSTTAPPASASFQYCASYQMLLSLSPCFLTQLESAINPANLLGLVLQELPTSEFVACGQGVSYVASQDL